MTTLVATSTSSGNRRMPQLTAAEWANVIAVFALAISVVAIFVSMRTSREQNRFLEEQTQIERERLHREREDHEASRRADVRVTLQKIQYDWYFVLRNYGRSSAYDVDLRFPDDTCDPPSAGAESRVTATASAPGSHRSALPAAELSEPGTRHRAAAYLAGSCSNDRRHCALQK